jgi:hypothetical protein
MDDQVATDHGQLLVQAIESHVLPAVCVEDNVTDHEPIARAGRKVMWRGGYVR